MTVELKIPSKFIDQLNRPAQEGKATVEGSWPPAPKKASTEAVVRLPSLQDLEIESTGTRVNFEVLVDVLGNETQETSNELPEPEKDELKRVWNSTSNAPSKERTEAVPSSQLRHQERWPRDVCLVDYEPGLFADHRLETVRSLDASFLGISDADVADIVRYGSSLIWLSLEGNPHITRQSVLDIARRLPKLRWLQLRDTGFDATPYLESAYDDTVNVALPVEAAQLLAEICHKRIPRWLSLGRKELAEDGFCQMPADEFFDDSTLGGVHEWWD